jgi:hypothetical protein
MYIAGLSRVQSVQTGFGAHSATYSLDTARCFPGVRQLGPKADHLP